MYGEECVSLDVAKVLAEKGFNNICLLHWEEWNEGHCHALSSVTGNIHTQSNRSLKKYFEGAGTVPDEKLYAAPTRGQVLDWLLERGISVNVFQDDDSSEPWTYEIYKVDEEGASEECLVHHTGEYWPRKEWRQAWDKAFLMALTYVKGDEQ